MDFLRNLVPANLERYLRGIDFPIGKQELLRRLEQRAEPGPPTGVVCGAAASGFRRVMAMRPMIAEDLIKGFRLQ
jgi:hypothetical protein